jgi:sugar lactone lactonase YvrE
VVALAHQLLCEPAMRLVLMCTVAACFGPNTVVLATSRAPSAIAVDTTSVYWTDPIEGTIHRVSSGGHGDEIFASNQRTPSAIAVGATSLFWANQGDGSFMSLPLEGGTPRALASSQNEPIAIAVGRDAVFWADAGSPGSNHDGSIVKVPFDGGAPITIASNQSNPAGIAVDDKFAYWSSVTLGTIMKVPVGGGTPETLVATGRSPLGITVDASAVYWTNYDGEVLKHVLADPTGGFVTLANGHFSQGTGIATDGASVFFSVADGEIVEVPAAGGAATQLSTSENAPASVALDSSAVYWVDVGNGTICKHDRPSRAPSERVSSRR